MDINFFQKGRTRVGVLTFCFHFTFKGELGRIISKSISMQFLLHKIAQKSCFYSA